MALSQERTLQAKSNASDQEMDFPLRLIINRTKITPSELYQNDGIVKDSRQKFLYQNLGPFRIRTDS